MSQPLSRRNRSKVGTTYINNEVSVVALRNNKQALHRLVPYRLLIHAHVFPFLNIHYPVPFTHTIVCTCDRLR
jgi:hypothetical protein